MNSEIEMSNSNIDIERNDFKYILGNIFFTEQNIYALVRFS